MPIVAVEAIDDLARSGQAESLSAMIATAISSTNKFRVMERKQLDKLVTEQGRAKAGLVTSRTPGRVGGFEGVDYQIYGSITALGAAQKSDMGMNLLRGVLSNNAVGSNCTSSQVTLSIDIKITDSDTGEIKYVGKVNETGKSATLCNGSNGQIDAASLLRQAADHIATRLVTTVYPIQVAAVQADGTLVLNYGEGAVNIGDTMTVFQKGQPIIDPANGSVLGYDDIPLGLIQVTDVLPRMSKAVTSTPFTATPAAGAIVRPSSANDIARFKPGKKRR